MRFFGAFGAAWNDAMVARWSNSLLWPEMDATPAVATAARRPRGAEVRAHYCGSVE